MREPWITEPGVYDLTDDEYHADPVVGGSLSSSGARTILNRSPAEFRYGERIDKGHFDFGHAVHADLLGVGARVVVIEADDWRTKKAQQERKDIRAAGGVPILRTEEPTVKAMVAEVRRHPVAGPLFARPGRAEVSLVSPPDPATGVTCRARIDWFPDVEPGERRIIVDYKSTKDSHPAAFARAVWEYGYNMQGPWYGDVLSWLGMDNGIPPYFVLVVQSKEKPYLVTYGWPSARSIEWGRVRNRKARAIYAACVASGEWPGYGNEPQEWDIPDWLDRQYTNDYDAGLYDIPGDIR